MNLQIPTAPPGKRFGKFRPLAVLGRGGMANVYLAVSSGPGGFNKLVVVKELKPELADEPEFRTMFLDEARLAARLLHPNVVQTYEVIDAPDLHAFVMEYLDGQPMNRVRTRLQQMGRELALGAQLRIICELLAGLHYAHELKDYDGTPLNIVHRDVSPHNVFISYDGSVKVVDFGIAKASDSSAQTQVGVIKGKLSYMAPEQALGQTIDRRADLFAVGLILWEAATGQRIWKGMQDAVILNLLSTGAIPRIDAIEPDVPPELVAVCQRALAQSADERYATAGDFLADLERVMRTSMPACPGTRELGVLLTQSFEEERTKIRAVIEEQMCSAKTAPTGEFHAPLLAQLAPATAPTPSHSQVSNVVSLPSVMSSQTGSHVTAGPQTLSPAVPRSSPLKVAAIAAGAVIVIGALAVLGMNAVKNPASQTTASPPSAAPTQTQTAAVSATAPTPTLPANARVTINITPKTARTTLDGKSIITPGPTVLRADGKPHVLRVEAQGYQTRTMDVVLDGDKVLDVALDKNGATPTVPNIPHTGTAHPVGSGEPDLGF